MGERSAQVVDPRLSAEREVRFRITSMGKLYEASQFYVIS